MPSLTEPNDPSLVAPRAVQALSGMFDDVSGRYDFLNSVMSLGQDGAWRAALARTVPESTRVCLDLCCGSGSSLVGLLRPGRLVVGMDASLAMLRLAAESYGSAGWAPRLAAADAFRLPLRDGTVDAVTVAFGVRNLRPRAEALREIARVLRPGGTLAVLEAVAPRRGPLAPLHAFYLRRLVPLAGRLSPDPAAYSYLSRSVFEFGDGAEFERDLKAAGFALEERRRFLFGATGLWAARREGEKGPASGATSGGEKSAGSPNVVQDALRSGTAGGHFAHPGSQAEREWRIWTITQLAFSTALALSLAWALRVYINLGFRLPLEPWPRRGLGILLGLGLVGFGARSLLLALRLQGRARVR